MGPVVVSVAVEEIHQIAAVVAVAAVEEGIYQTVVVVAVAAEEIHQTAAVVEVAGDWLVQGTVGSYLRIFG